MRWSCAMFAVRASRLSLLRAARFADRLRGRNGRSAARAQSRVPARTDAPSTGRPPALAADVTTVRLMTAGHPGYGGPLGHPIEAPVNW